MEVNRHGPTVVYQPKETDDHNLDIVVVHGLFGHPKKTWSLNVPVTNGHVDLTKEAHFTESSEDEGAPPSSVWNGKRKGNATKELFRDVYWPRDLLPQTFPNARVIVWGYDVQIESLMSSTSQASIFQHSENLLWDLLMLRKTPREKSAPLIFIAHSLGGIVVKDALSLSRTERTALSQILPATIGVMFLGTPHHGSAVASLGKIAFEISKIFFRKPNLRILRGLETNSEILDRISHSFAQVLDEGKPRVHSFCEELPTKGVMIVEAASATIGSSNETRGSIHGNHRQMAKFASTNDVMYKRVVSILQDWVEEFPLVPKAQQGSSSILEGLLDQETSEELFADCINSLRVNEAEHRLEGIEPAHKSTYDWLYDRKVGFEDWLEGKEANNTYWIQGKPGSGKSTLMKFALQDPRTVTHLKKNHRGCWVLGGFFFHDRGTSAQKTVQGFLKHILYQILEQEEKLFECILPVFTTMIGDKRKNRGETVEKIPEWTLKKLQEAFSNIRQQTKIGVNLCLFVDALDEHSGNHRDLIRTLREMANLADNPRFRARLVLAGRAENVFKSSFRSCPGFAIHEFITDDIRQYTEDRIQQEAHGGIGMNDDKWLARFKDAVVCKAQGVFLWVRLAIDEIMEGICEGATIGELDQLLSIIPTELDQLYTRALERSMRNSTETTAKHKTEAYVMFTIGAGALSPLSLREFITCVLGIVTAQKADHEVDSLSDEQLERRLYSRSSGLLERSTNGDVQFIHQTAKEYVLRGSGATLICGDVPEHFKKTAAELVFDDIVRMFGKHYKNTFARRFVRKHFIDYAQYLEWTEQKCIADQFQSVFMLLPGEEQYRLLTEYLRHHPPLLPKKVSRTFRTILTFYGNSQPTKPGYLTYTLFYLFTNLPLSFAKSISSARSQFDAADCYSLLSVANVPPRTVDESRTIHQVLVDEGIIEQAIADESDDGKSYAEWLVQRLLGLEVPASGTMKPDYESQRVASPRLKPQAVVIVNEATTETIAETITESSDQVVDIVLAE